MVVMGIPEMAIGDEGVEHRNRIQTESPLLVLHQGGTSERERAVLTAPEQWSCRAPRVGRPRFESPWKQAFPACRILDSLPL